MKEINEQNTRIFYLQDSTAASISTGSYSSAKEGNLSFILRNSILLIDPIQSEDPHAANNAFITKVEREQIKKTYPKPSLAKSPAIGEDLNIL